MRFQRGPVMAYAAVVLIGLLVIIQTLSPDVSSLHRVPRTLSGQAEFTVIPPAPSAGVSGVSKIPSAAAEENGDTGQGAAAEPDEQAEKKPEKAPPAPPAEQQPDAPSPDQPAEPADPGGDEGGAKPPTLVPPVGPIPGIMAPLLWPFVAEKDARPVDQAVPMFLQQLLAAEAGVPVESLPMKDPKDAREAEESTGESKEPAPKPDGPGSEAERIVEGVCELTAAIAEDLKELPGASEAPEPRATPECGEACTEPKTPVGSSPAADPEASTDSAEPSDAETTEPPERSEQPKDGSKDEKTCAEKSVQ
ncbi:hypothetical protein [Nocardioides sp.]|uniref:hypothetical protein n=1 Tax=Nocardioides sp. TaxID=35761 RepID=UPI0019A5F9E2|nr:hypothetical protein [Nocardioides sp.]MBC7276937.1 hypothetical protein [Nocardioides sp.]